MGSARVPGAHAGRVAPDPECPRRVRRLPEGGALQADQRTFWTLSARESPEALKGFARAGAHAPTPRGLSAQTRESKFASWSAAGDALPVSWAEVRRRLK
ncbi:hypothetical protein GCM10010424_20620 [Streptomyces lienomycini]